ncbi:MAG: isocitrate/isopropylmalate family dehydrogenase [Actinomycetia bacterium]|nr:isocitrate/isopropylmalate family dehydrogenase [Actinomycetes bacterium]
MSAITVSADGTLVVPDVVTIPCITGDGIGVEITPVMKAVVDAALDGTGRRIEWLEAPAGEASFEASGEWLPEATLEACRTYHVSIKGPLTTPVGGGIRSLNVALRQALDLYACVRPVRWFEGVASPVREPWKVDMVIFRENTEDVYAGIEWAAGSEEAAKLYRFLHDELGVTQVRFPDSSAFGIKPISREGSRRLVRAACRYAVEHDRPSVTLVHKGNIMKHTEGGFRAWGYELAAEEFPDLTVKDSIADAFLQATLRRPAEHSVIATPNLNGDYISDSLAAQVGGIGIAPGANINYETGHAAFEATHGTAPKYVGQNRANPSSLLMSAVMMLEYLGWQDSADAITRAMAACYREGVATPDLAPSPDVAVSTQGFGEAIIARLGDPR